MSSIEVTVDNINKEPEKKREYIQFVIDKINRLFTEPHDNMSMRKLFVLNACLNFCLPHGDDYDSWFLTFMNQFLDPIWLLWYPGWIIKKKSYDNFFRNIEKIFYENFEKIIKKDNKFGFRAEFVQVNSIIINDSSANTHHPEGKVYTLDDVLKILKPEEDKLNSYLNKTYHNKQLNILVFISKMKKLEQEILPLLEAGRSFKVFETFSDGDKDEEKRKLEVVLKAIRESKKNDDYSYEREIERENLINLDKEKNGGILFVHRWEIPRPNSSYLHVISSLLWASYKEPTKKSSELPQIENNIKIIKFRTLPFYELYTYYENAQIKSLIFEPPLPKSLFKDDRDNHDNFTLSGTVKVSKIGEKESTEHILLRREDIGQVLEKRSLYEELQSKILDEFLIPGEDFRTWVTKKYFERFR